MEKRMLLDDEERDDVSPVHGIRGLKILSLPRRVAGGSIKNKYQVSDWAPVELA